MIDKSHRWQKTAVAAAAFAFLGFTQSSALALSLGRISVLSALGEPLRAEIEIPEINAEEAASLRTEIAGPAAFAAAGLEYNAAMSGLRATLQRRTDGRAYIRLVGEKSVNEPFVDLIMEATWSSGRIVRDYTMLLDPPLTKATPVPAPTLAQAPSIQTPAGTPATSNQPAAIPTRPALTQPKPASLTQPTAPLQVRTAPKLSAASGQQITVKSGDTASKIATQNLSNGVSLDQMLVAMMRANPDAFIKGNLNRIKSGAVLNVPSAEQAQSVAPGEASQMVIAQSKDFNDFRRNLATNAPKADVAPADRQSTGSIDAKVDDKKPAVATPDKLTLSKGSVQGKATEAQLAKERADKDAAARAAEIAKNIADLDKLSAASAPKIPVPTVAPIPATAASAPQQTLPAVAVAPTTPASAPQVAASAPTVAAPKAVIAAPAPEEAPGLLDELLGDPLVPAAAGGLVALLGGFAFYRIRQRNKNSARVDSSFLESRLQPDSFFGASGGQRVDTANDPHGNPSSIAYTSSQLDAADDVDPVAEADVYLAYGRDLQAEEILKEALRHNPGRLAIHVKLLEIFAKRRDATGFKATAQQAFKLTGVDNPDWEAICALGLSIDPDNALYQPGVASVSGFGPQEEAPTNKENSSGFGSTIAQSAAAELSSAPAGLDLDLDLDFSADDEPVAPAVEQTVKQEPHTAQESDSNAIEFDISEPGELRNTAASGSVPLSMDGVSLTDGGVETPLPTFDPSGTMPLSHDTVRSDPGLMEFDMGALSLDLDPPAEESASGAPSVFAEDPLETKLALADEFVSIGDEDGARALIEEVLSEATGEMRTKAQQALANLS